MHSERNPYLPTNKPLEIGNITGSILLCLDGVLHQGERRQKALTQTAAAGLYPNTWCKGAFRNFNNHLRSLPVVGNEACHHSKDADSNEPYP